MIQLLLLLLFRFLIFIPVSRLSHIYSLPASSQKPQSFRVRLCDIKCLTRARLATAVRWADPCEGLLGP